jgi:hypothetical protein
MAPIDPVELAEKIISLLDSASYTTTYKWATLDAIVQVLTENIQPDGQLPQSISAKAVGTKVLESYWRQSVPFSGTEDAKHRFLKQSSSDGDIPSKIAQFRLKHKLTAANDSLSSARTKFSSDFAALEQLAQDTIIRMPIPKLQRFGDGATTTELRFLYEYSWEDEVPVGKIHRLNFDDALRFQPGVAAGLIKIQNLIRPYLENLWIQWVADRNPDITDAAKLHNFLFGVDRKSLAKVKPYIISAQNEKCFYCETPLTANIEVDHFLPFSKHTDDALDNLVASCKKCNGSKSDSYPSVHHLKKWWTRFQEGTEVFNTLNHISETTSHLRDPLATASKARAVYLNKSEGALLWHAVGEMVPLHTGEAEAALLPNH